MFVGGQVEVYNPANESCSSRKLVGEHTTEKACRFCSSTLRWTNGWLSKQRTFSFLKYPRFIALAIEICILAMVKLQDLIPAADVIC